MYSFCGNFCRLLIAFANSLDPDQDRHLVGPDLDPNYLTPKEFFKKVNFEKLADDNKEHEKLPSMQRANFCLI